MTEPTKYGEGFHDMPELNYHSDPAPEPSLSATVAKILWDKTPLHAQWAHPRFHPEIVLADKAPTRAKEIGTAAHKLILGKGRELAIIPFDDYRIKVAQDFRRAAYEECRAPILKPDHDKARELAEAAMKQLQGTELERFGRDGQAEVTALWQEGPIWCRSRIDWLPDGDNHLTIVDVKTTATSANPLDWQATMADLGADIQAAFYERAVTRLRKPKSCRLVFLVIEQDPPYAVSINQPSGEAMENARAAVQSAISIWEQCLRTGEWPGYDKATQHIDAPPWARIKHESRYLVYRHLLEVMARWQAPIAGPKP